MHRFCRLRKGVRWEKEGLARQQGVGGSNDGVDEQCDWRYNRILLGERGVSVLLSLDLIVSG